MGRTDNAAPYAPNRPGRGATLRRMQTDVPSASTRAGPSIGSRGSSSSRFWDTVMLPQGASSSAQSTSPFHNSFSSQAGSSSSHVQAMQSFHGTTSGSSSRMLSGQPLSRRYSCRECHSVFSSQAELTQHTRTKHTHPFICELCSNTFSQRSHLNQHVRTVHNKVKPHKCHICPKAFGKKYDLQSHLVAVHGNEKPHACQWCDKKFAKRSNLTRHIHKLHPEQSHSR